MYKTFYSKTERNEQNCIILQKFLHFKTFDFIRIHTYLFTNKLITIEYRISIFLHRTIFYEYFFTRQIIDKSLSLIHLQKNFQIIKKKRIVKIWKKRKRIYQDALTYESTYIKEFIINSSHIVSLDPISPRVTSIRSSESEPD